MSGRIPKELLIVAGALVFCLAFALFFTLVVRKSWSRNRAHEAARSLPAPAEMLADVAALADPAMRGRAEETGGAEIAAAWIEKRFQAIGCSVERQPFTIVKRRVLDGTRLEINGRTLKPGADFAPLSQSPAGDVTTILTPGLAARITGDNGGVQGCIAVEFLNPAPGAFRTLDPPLAERAVALQALGAVAVIFVAGFNDLEAGGEAAWPNRLSAYSEARLKTEPAEIQDWLRDRAATGAQSRAPRPSQPLRIPAVLVGNGEARAIEAAMTQGAHLVVSIEDRPVEGTNILAHFPGTRVGLAPVLVSAHYDSHGVQPPSPGFPQGRVYPGACDNASGIAVLLAVARAVAHDPLPRPVLFAAFGGEELGLAGSRVFAGQVHNLLCDFNVDMAGRGPKDEMTIVGAAFAPELAEIARGALETARFTVKTNIDFTYRFGSDHWSLHKAGIPSVLFTCSRFPECDRPEDTLDLLSGAKMRRVAEAVLIAVGRTAERETGFPPPVDAIVKFPGEK